MLTLQFRDKEIVCIQCQRPFVWGASEQEFFAVMGFDNDPRRCPKCRAERRQIMQERMSMRHPVFCSSCGKPASVPFVPSQGRPVYCQECYEKLSHAHAEMDRQASAAAA